jgi:hypothetical protein
MMFGPMYNAELRKSTRPFTISCFEVSDTTFLSEAVSASRYALPRPVSARHCKTWPSVAALVLFNSRAMVHSTGLQDFCKCPAFKISGFIDWLVTVEDGRDKRRGGIQNKKKRKGI